MPRSVVVLTVVAMLATLTPSALAAVITNESSPFNETVTNPCNGDPIILSGTQRFMVAVTENPAGGILVINQGNLQDVSGVDEITGASYHFAAGSAMPTLDAPSGTRVVIIPENQELIGQGSAPDFRFHSLDHETLNPNGTVTMSFITFTTECQ